MSRLGGNVNLGICQHCHHETEDPLHAFFSCQHSSVAGHALLGYVQTLVPTLSPEAALRLEVNTGTNDDENLAAVYMLATGLKYIWETRISKKQVSLFRMRSEVEAQITLLRKTRHRNIAETLFGMMQQLVVQ